MVFLSILWATTFVLALLIILNPNNVFPLALGFIVGYAVSRLEK